VGYWTTEPGDGRVLLAETGEMALCADPTQYDDQTGATRYSKSVDAGSGAGFGRVACDGIKTTVQLDGSILP
jgi:hypothetical protein